MTPVLLLMRRLQRGVLAHRRLLAVLCALATVAFAPGSVPHGTLGARAVVGRTTAAPVRAGEALTDVRLVRASTLAGYPGLSAVPVRIADAGAVRLLRVGDLIDLLASDPQGQDPPRWVGRAVRVLAIPRPTDSQGGTAQGPAQSGALVVLALPPSAVQTAGAASVSAYLSFSIVG